MILQLERYFSIFVMLFCVAVFVGCASSSSQPNGQTNGQISASANAQSNAQSGIKAPPRVAVKSGDKIGVAECDQYLEKYEACAKNKVPEPGRGAMLSSIEQLRTSWITIAVNPETRENLAKDCKQTLEETKKNLSAYACAW